MFYPEHRTRCLIIILLLIMSANVNARTSEFLRGVVYDVGLNYSDSGLSVKNFDTIQVEYDMSVISHILRCNSVRIEGEDLSRLASASRIAHKAGLKVFFNPWKMGAGPEETIAFMTKAAKVARDLKNDGADITMVTGCEYSIFSKGAIPGDTFDQRFHWLSEVGSRFASGDKNVGKEFQESNIRLNEILGAISKAVRNEFDGPVTYSSGTWEMVDWDNFDIIALDHYQQGEPDEEYMNVVKRLKGDKPVVVLETGCCAYKGAALKGSVGFTVFLGIDAEGKPIYEGGTAPERSEAEQAEYVKHQVELLSADDGADGVFIFVFRFPVYPYSETSIDMDMISYSLVKSFEADDPRSTQMPPWIPKEAFYTLGSIYSSLADR